MKLSTRGEYAVRAMIRLARLHEDGPVSLREIAQVEGISQQYLEQLFVELRRAGLVHSQRGVNGGYHLAREPAQISVGEIVRAVEGPLALVDCLNGVNQECCETLKSCVSREVWKKLQDTMNEVLNEMTLEKVIHSNPFSKSTIPT